MVESILLSEDKLQDYQKKHGYAEEYIQEIRSVCEKIGPRATAKYGIWLAEVLTLTSQDIQTVYEILEKYDRISNSPSFSGHKEIDKYEFFPDL